jgi:hypothetical protein
MNEGGGMDGTNDANVISFEATGHNVLYEQGGGPLCSVAALYVNTGGVYFGLEGVDPWDKERDARLYDGPYPVVAHPPCNHWCQLASVNAARYATFKIGDDDGCFEAALRSVRMFGGVLEHPAYSLAWIEFGLPVPGHGGWTQAMDDPGWTTAVSQVAYGHAARKRTWLYAVGCDLPALNWSEPQARGQVGSGPHPGTKALRLQGGKSSSTPPEFRDALIAMARTSRMAVAA